MDNPHPRRKFDPTRIKELYESGLLASQVAAEVGCSQDAVYYNLHKLGVPVRDDRDKNQGRARLEVCNQGHEMTDENVRERQTKQGIKRYCIICERARWRRRQRRRANEAIIAQFILEQSDDR